MIVSDKKFYQFENIVKLFVFYNRLTSRTHFCIITFKSSTTEHAVRLSGLQVHPLIRLSCTAAGHSGSVLHTEELSSEIRTAPHQAY